MPTAPVIEQVDPQGPVAMALLRQAAAEARALYPELVRPNAPPPTNAPTPDRGVYLVAFVDGAGVACGALRPIDGEIAEVKRMFVVRDSRRRGLARAILDALQEHARSFGFSRLRLETGNRQAAAIALYESCGFEHIAAFGEHANDPTSVCFEKRLGVGKGAVVG
ncbi:MAG: GNAT family N-acetyltransferase [Burkholderiales bacterium]|nr:GNAT family N-acetyltransferase [Burkholderiales bacterium]